MMPDAQRSTLDAREDLRFEISPRKTPKCQAVLSCFSFLFGNVRIRTRNTLGRHMYTCNG